MNPLKRLLQRRTIVDDLSEEMRQHLEEKIEALVAQGMPREEAVHAARRAFGNPTLLEQRGREVWMWPWIESIWADIKFALRQLRKSPGFAFTAILTLALGIGATAAVFSVIYAVLLRPLPFRSPDQLVVVKEDLSRFGGPMDLPPPDVLQFVRESHVFEHAGGYRQIVMELSGEGEPQQLTAARMTAGVLPTLGVQPMLGRFFTQQEDDHNQTVAILSYGLWKSRFHGDPSVLGRIIDLDRKPYTVIGVMPRSFEFPLVPGRLSQTQLWVPMSFTPVERKDAGDNFDYSFVARLKPNISNAQAKQDIDPIAREILSEYPAHLPGTLTALSMPLKQATIGQAKPLVRLLFAAVLVVLLIACANLVGLLLVRAIEHRREIAMRLALGARAGSILRQAMLESLLLSAGGGVLGVWLAASAMRIWTHLLPDTLPRLSEVGLHWGVVAFALMASLGTGILCGLAPAFAALHTDINEVLKSGGRSGNTSSNHARLRSTLVIGEIATALVLLTAAGLLLRSFQKMRDVDPGFQPERIVATQFNLPSERYQTQAQVDEFERQLLQRLRQLPGVQATAFSTALPMAEATSTRSFTADGYQYPKNSSYVFEANAYLVGDYFRTMGIPLLRGRDFTEADNSVKALPVIVVNQTLARMFWPGQDPVGKRIRWGLPETTYSRPWMIVIGEVADTHQGALDTKSIPQAYEPLAQEQMEFGELGKEPYFRVVGQSMRLVVRTIGDPQTMESSIRKTAWSLDPQLAVGRMQTMEQAISTTEAPRRFNSTVLTIFSLAAVFAVLGIYAMIAFTVTQRAQEMAIRMALGAQRGDVIRMVLREGLKLGVTGCALGLFGAAIISEFLRSLLFQVSPFDLAAFAFATSAVLLLTVVGSFLPARRAASVDPMQALRAE